MNTAEVIVNLSKRSNHQGVLQSGYSIGCQCQIFFPVKLKMLHHTAKFLKINSSKNLVHTLLYT